MKLVAYDPKMLTVKSGPRMVKGVGKRSLGPQGEPIDIPDEDEEVENEDAVPSRRMRIRSLLSSLSDLLDEDEDEEKE